MTMSIVCKLLGIPSFNTLLIGLYKLYQDIDCDAHNYFPPTSTYIHLIPNESVPSLQILHTARESVNDDLLLTLGLVVADLLEKKIDGDLTRDNQTLLDVVINQLRILASAIYYFLPHSCLYLAFSSRRQSPALIGTHPSFSFRVEDTVPFPIHNWVLKQVLTRTRSAKQEDDMRLLFLHRSSFLNLARLTFTNGLLLLLPVYLVIDFDVSYTSCTCSIREQDQQQLQQPQ